jgi:pimeloyl-ACP methyl ester carboxylesterase
LPDKVVAGWRLGEKDVPTAIKKVGFSKWIDRTLPGNDLSDSDPKMLAWNWTERKKQPQHVMASYFAWAEKFDVSGLLPKINVPTLILAAGKAVDATLEDSRFMEQQIRMLN